MNHLIHLFKCFYVFYFVCLNVCVHIHMLGPAHAEYQRLTCGHGSFIPVWVMWREQNSDCHAWQQAELSGQPIYTPLKEFGFYFVGEEEL